MIPLQEKLWHEPIGDRFPVGPAADARWSLSSSQPAMPQALLCSQWGSWESKGRRGCSGREPTQSWKKLPCSEELPPKGALRKHRIHMIISQLLQELFCSYTTPLLLTEFHTRNCMRNVALCYKNKTGPALSWRIWCCPYLPTFGLGPQSGPFARLKEKK